jgi:hypothetical protein
VDAYLAARGHFTADSLDLLTVKHSRGDRKHLPIFNRDVMLV